MFKYWVIALLILGSAPTVRAADDLGGEAEVENEMDREDDGSSAPNPDASPAPASDVPVADDPVTNDPVPDDPPRSGEPLPTEDPRAPLVAEPERPSSTPGEKIFDWQKHRGERAVKHPFASKGLVRITRDKTYLYKVSETDQKRAADLHVGMYNPTNLSNPKDSGPNSTYENNYQGAATAAFFNYEWQLRRTPLGKFGVRAGGGLFVAQGNGHFVNNSDLKPLEIFTLIGVPAAVGAVYRMQIFERQMLIPYAEGGGILWAMAELRDDNKKPKFGGIPAAYAAFGVALNLTYFNAISKVALDREYGINSVYLLAEYRGILGLSRNYDMTAGVANGGLLVEF